MKLSIISFTKSGKLLSEDIMEKLVRTEIRIDLFTKHKMQETGDGGYSVIFVEESVSKWAGTQMQEKNAMLFIGACGIAVRAVAPYLADKLHDSPVLVMDEKGRYVIPVLSGHMGGANALALLLAEKTGAEPVITTATDINRKFAVDLFAKRNGFSVVNKEGIAKVSSKVLAGEEISLCAECTETVRIAEDAGKMPSGVRVVPYPPDGPVDVLIASDGKTYDAALLLTPKKYVVGLGCKKGKQADEIGRLIERQLEKTGILKTQILALASVSQKKEEPGIIEWCRREAIPFLTYTAEELWAVAGSFHRSDFVMNAVGVDNVCERAALKACGAGGCLILQKYAENGMTIAIAERKWKVAFDSE